MKIFFRSLYKNVRVRNRLLLATSFIALLLIVVSCTDSLEKAVTFVDNVRIEYSDCSGCQECLLDFECPEGAIKFDSLRVKAYIDADKCVQCMECINLFNCPDNAFTLSQDLISPAALEGVEIYSDIPGDLTIKFQSTGDDSLSGKAYRYELLLLDENNHEITTDFELPLPINPGFQEYWIIPDLEEDALLTVSIQVFDEVGNAAPVMTEIVRVMGNHFPPAPINTLTISNIGAELFQLNWYAVGNNGIVGNAAYYIVKVHTDTITEENWDSIADYEQNIIPAPPITQETLLIEGLEYSTEYFAAIKAVDDSSNVAPISVVVSATTLSAPDITSPAAITDLTASSPGMNSFTLAWTAVGDDELEGIAQNYIIKVFTEEITNANWDGIAEIEQNMVPAEAGHPETFIVTGLESLTAYYAAVKAVDDANNYAPISNSASAVTTEIPDTDPPAAIDDLMAIGADTEINLSWTAPGDDGNTGTAFSYEIRYYQEEITELNWPNASEFSDPPVPLIAGTIQNYTALELEVGFEYYFAIKAIDESFNSAAISNCPSVILAGDIVPPAAITDLLADAGETEIILSWTAPGDDGITGTATGYEIRMAQTEITETNWADAEELSGTPWPLIAGSAQDYTVTDLELGNTYYFAVKAYDENDNYALLSNVPNAQLVEDLIPPADISNLSVFAGYASNLSTIKINWTAPGDNGEVGTCDHYEIRYSNTPITEANWISATEFTSPPAPEAAGANQSCNIIGLNSATIYYFAVKAVDDAGNINNVSNSPGGKIVYQINTGACHNCNNQCIYDCDEGAIQQGPGYKFIDPDLCTACGDCDCPWNLIYQAVVAY